MVCVFVRVSLVILVAYERSALVHIDLKRGPVLRHFAGCCLSELSGANN